MLDGMGNRPSGDPKIRAKDIFAMIDVNQDGVIELASPWTGRWPVHLWF